MQLNGYKHGIIVHYRPSVKSEKTFENLSEIIKNNKRFMRQAFEPVVARTQLLQKNEHQKCRLA